MNRDFSYAVAQLNLRAAAERDNAQQPRVVGCLTEEEYAAKASEHLRNAESCERAAAVLAMHDQFEPMEFKA